MCGKRVVSAKSEVEISGKKVGHRWLFKQPQRSHPAPFPPTSTQSKMAPTKRGRSRTLTVSGHAPKRTKHTDSGRRSRGTTTSRVSKQTRTNRSFKGMIRNGTRRSTKQRASAGQGSKDTHPNPSIILANKHSAWLWHTQIHESPTRLRETVEKCPSPDGHKCRGD